jgi:hypothetical protein
MRKVLALLIVISLVLSSAAYAISRNEPLKKLSNGLDNIVYGKMEVPDNINETNSKGSRAFSKCTDTTKDDVGRGIARIVGGVWELATFWYPVD